MSADATAHTPTHLAVSQNAALRRDRDADESKAVVAETVGSACTPACTPMSRAVRIYGDLMRHVPWWALLSSGSAPVLLTGGWTVAERLQRHGYNPVTKTISVLAAYGAPGYWAMTGILIALGACYLITAVGLRVAAAAGRMALGGGGVFTIMLTLFPAPTRGGDFGHGTVVTVGFILMAFWPVLAAERNGPSAWALRPRVAVKASALMCVGAVWFLIELQRNGAAGIAERVLTFAQALWPLVVVVSCVRHQVRHKSV